LTPGSNKVTTVSGQSANISVIKLTTGQNYTSCVGTFEVKTDKALANGQYYYARVFDYNEIGYSLPQISSSQQKPMVTPGAPTSVVLSVVSETELRVTFNPPADDGGDVITSYKIDYSTSSDFSNLKSLYVTVLDGGAPFFKTITQLEKGVYVFVRVSAANSQGYGDKTSSVPTSLNPYQASSAPSNVLLRVTSDTMLTVSFGAPVDNGGDPIKSYRVEWDIAPGFNSVVSTPFKGYVDLDASLYSSYTLTYLSKGQYYYVRVFAINSAGLGNPALSSPSYLAPSLQVPGKPHTIFAVTGTSVGQIKVSWQRPRIPAHGIPCFGLATAPKDCPSTIAGSTPASDGGSVIKEYEIEFNDLADFSGFDSGKVTTTNTFYTLINLTPDRKYYIRVLARNAQGAGSFCQFVDQNCLIVSQEVYAISKALITST
jgi:hypothetical protein